MTAKRVLGKKTNGDNPPKEQSQIGKSEILGNLDKRVDDISQPVYRPEQKTQVGFKDEQLSVYKELYLDEIQKQNKI